ncbi:hypothetical protein [Rhizobium leguminosarum]|uniref:TRAFAC clade GTPase domain-containing protein n=1 Tax=Rhizobium leguminosarum TaxID=384 RepID=UPI0021BBC9CE|nr:hypothetical protein [Rhizobium leguminosarum]
MSQSILLLGEYNVGKSHFGGQLLGRLTEEKGALKMAGAPPSLAPFDGILACLNDGRAAPHTPSSSYLEGRWPVQDDHGHSVDLLWPDYGGEQIRTIRAERRMPPEWRKRVETSSGWILMVRIHNSHVSDDIFSRPLIELKNEIEPPNNEFSMSDQARVVDFLQWLMFIHGASKLTRIAEPRLLLLLSCWDELPEAEQSRAPREVLRHRLPMVASFVETNWEDNSLHILGLSALERALSEERRDEDYVDMGPESFGYVILPGGERSSDLTLAITPLL